jgi:hypothetical protein
VNPRGSYRRGVATAPSSRIAVGGAWPGDNPKTPEYDQFGTVPASTRPLADASWTTAPHPVLQPMISSAGARQPLASSDLVCCGARPRPGSVTAEARATDRFSSLTPRPGMVARSCRGLLHPRGDCSRYRANLPVHRAGTRAPTVARSMTGVGIPAVPPVVAVRRRCGSAAPADVGSASV